MCPGCLLFVIVKSDFVHVHCIFFCFDSGRFESVDSSELVKR